MWLARNVINKDGTWTDYLEILYKTFVIRVSEKVYMAKYLISLPTLEEKHGYEQLSLFE